MVRGDLVTKTRSGLEKMDEAIKRRATKKSASYPDALFVGVGVSLAARFLDRYGPAQSAFL